MHITPIILSKLQFWNAETQCVMKWGLLPLVGGVTARGGTPRIPLTTTAPNPAITTTCFYFIHFVYRCVFYRSLTKSQSTMVKESGCHEQYWKVINWLRWPVLSEQYCLIIPYSFLIFYEEIYNAVISYEYDKIYFKFRCS